MSVLLAARAGAAAGHPGYQLLYAMLPLVILAVLFDTYCLRDLIRAPSVRHLPKAVWAIIILLSAPWGGLIYLFAGRDRSQGRAVPR